MASIPIHNETEYVLTDEITQQIIRDAQEDFGEEVRAIRVQYGVERHAFNARTREVRYAFSPNDFGVVPTIPTAPETPRSRRRPPRRDEETEAESRPAPFADVEVDAEEPAPRDTSLESIEEGRDDDEDNDDEEDESFFEHDAHDA